MKVMSPYSSFSVAVLRRCELLLQMQYTVSLKCRCFVSLWLWPIWVDFGNFWRKCFRESGQSKGTLFSHLT